MTATRLQILRSQLAALRQARATARQLSAFSALGTAILSSLFGVFVLDFIFQREMQAPQRLVLLLIAMGVIVWAFRRYALPLLLVQESEVDMALMVERQHQIDSDLVAAIQFEHDVEGRWGSRQLELAVIDYVAHVGKDIDVYQGFDRQQLRRRATIFGVTAAAVVLAALIFPGHFSAFLNRAALGSAHYPSWTQIESLAINGRNVLIAGMQPQSIRCAEGREIEFLLRVDGKVPEAGIARLSSKERFGRSEVELRPLTDDERLARLQAAQKMVDEARQSPGIDLAGPWLEELAGLVQFEAPDEWSALALDPNELSASELGQQAQTKLPEIAKLINDLIASWPVGVPPSGGKEPAKAGTPTAALFIGQLPRLNEPVTYRVTLGDAYTDPAEISMIALPAVEAKLTPVPPKYAAKALAAEPAGRQAAVLVGSDVKVAIECTNKKSLKEAWIIVRTAGSTNAKRYDLQSTNQDRTQWSLVASNTPLNDVQEELRYEIQVTDDDGLHLETPIKGSVRIRIDKPPIAIASTVHRVVLPTARPSIHYRVGDDFGIKRLVLRVEVERQAASQSGAQATDPASSESSLQSSDPNDEPNSEPAPRMEPETTVFNLLASSPVTLERLPLSGKSPLNLASLQLDPSRGALEKGDRLKVVLEAEDDRGGAPGETFRSEAIIIEVSDELGVASAVGEADPQAEQRVTEIIKRQLGIGESP